MRIIDFRSFSDETIKPVAGLFAIAGKNGVGKSNILRALNLFFNGEVEKSVPVDLREDFHRSHACKDEKVSRVEVGFDLPEVFRFRHGVRDAAEALELTSGPSPWPDNGTSNRRRGAL